MTAPSYLNAMRAFEASARHQSFSAAATELNVTPAAVGQLVRGLEAWLGKPLFHRGTGGRARLIPTEAAQQALPEIRAGFERLALGLERLRESAINTVLTVTTTPAFAMKWLLPRIESFQNAWPDIDLRLNTSLKTLDFATQGIDIGVRYGSGTWPGLIAEKLLSEEIYPVCAPFLLQQGAPLVSPADLVHHTLIHDASGESHTGFSSWEVWLDVAGVRDIPIHRGMRINNSAAVLQAAMDGRGIALARSVMARDDISAGRLVRLFPEIEYRSALAFYVVYRPESMGMSKLAAFREWIMEEASASECANGRSPA